MLKSKLAKRPVKKYAISNFKRRKSELAGNFEVKHHGLATIQKAAKPGLTRANKARFDTAAAKAT